MIPVNPLRTQPGRIVLDTYFAFPFPSITYLDMVSEI